MLTAMRLGARLATATHQQRRRSLLVATAAAVGTLTLLVVLGMVTLPQVRWWFGEPTGELRRLQAAIVATVALPVLALAGTVGRLSASLRDRRLANLRLMGLTATQTRFVAASESGLAATVGSVAGLVAFQVVRALPGTIHLAGLALRPGDLRPGAAAYVVAVAAVPLAVTVVAGIPHRMDPRRALERATRADGRRPSWWRLAPVLVGVALSRWFWSANDDHRLGNGEVAVFFVGTVLTGLGLVLVVPVFSRLVADLLAAVARGPVLLVAARRLQSQPAGVTRVVASLMIGLYLVVGARAVLAAFESTPQYVGAVEQLTERQWVVTSTSAKRADGVTDRVQRVEGVTDVVELPVLTGWQGAVFHRRHGADVPVVVASCAELARAAPDLRGCVEGEPLWLAPWPEGPPQEVSVTAVRNPARHPGEQLTFAVDAPVAHASSPRVGERAAAPLQGSLVVPPDLPGLAPYVDKARRDLVVVAEPGRGLMDALSDQAGVAAFYAPGIEDYDYVETLRAILLAIAAVVLSVGLLSFAVAAVDRASTRRRELASLQVVGTPASALRRAQWLEALVPTATGALLAIGTGFFSGVTYLHLDGEWREHLWLIWPTTATLAVAALVISVLVAGATVLATGTRLAPDVIRAE